MQEKTIKLSLSEKSAHVLYVGIIEHWANSHFKEKLSEEEFKTLESLRNALKAPYSQEKGVSPQELSVLAKAFEIGLYDLDPIEFPTIVGEPFEYGKNILSRINGFIASDRDGSLSLE